MTTFSVIMTTSGLDFVIPKNRWDSSSFYLLYSFYDNNDNKKGINDLYKKIGVNIYKNLGGCFCHSVVTPLILRR